MLADMSHILYSDKTQLQNCSRSTCHNSDPLFQGFYNSCEL